jgi:hypothetical protein
MTPSNLLELAKKGNARAIAQLINQSLQPNGITATATVKNGCLEVILEAELLPKQQIMANFIYQGALSLKADSITSLIVSGKKFSNARPSWSQTFDLSNPGAIASNSENIATAANREWKNLSSNTLNTTKKSKPFSPKPSRSDSRQNRLEKIVESVTEEPLSLEEKCEQRLREIGRFPREGSLSLSYYYAIPKLAKATLTLVQSPSEIIEAIAVRYRGELAALLLTDKYLACFFFPDFFQEAKKSFVFMLEQVDQVSIAPNGVIVHPKKFPLIKLFFPDKNFGQELIDSQLSQAMAIEKHRRINPDNYEVTLNLFGFFAFFIALGFNILAIYLVIQHILIYLIGSGN